MKWPLIRVTGLVAVALVGLTFGRRAGHRGDLRAMRNLLENLFKTYSSEMKKLNSEMIVSRENFKQVERKMNRRYTENLAAFFAT